MPTLPASLLSVMAPLLLCHCALEAVNPQLLLYLGYGFEGEVDCAGENAVLAQGEY